MGGVQSAAILSALRRGFLGGVAGAVVYAGPHVHVLCAFENPVLGEYRSFMDAGGRCGGWGRGGGGPSDSAEKANGGYGRIPLVARVSFI